MENKKQPKRIQTSTESIGYRLDKLHRALKLDMDPDLCAMYILTFYFYKYINDIFPDKQNSPFAVPENCRFEYICKHRNKKKIGIIINEVFAELESRNEDKLKGLLSIVDFNSTRLGRKNYRNLKLIHLIEEFSRINFNSPPYREENKNRIPDTFYYFISSNYQRGIDIPVYQAELLTKLLEPQDGQSICDPFCNAGSLLRSFALLNPYKDLLFFGQEKNRHLHALCKMGLYLQEVYQSEIELRDNLAESDSSLFESKYKLVVTKIYTRIPLPVRLRMKREGRPRFKIHYDRISKSLEMMDTGKGKAGFIVSGAFLSASEEYGDFWEHIFKENLLDAVIGFSYYPSQSGYFSNAVLVFKKDRTTSDVLFISVENRIRSFLKRINRDKNLEKVIDIYRQYKSEENLSCLAGIEEIRNNNFSIDINSYLETEKKEHSDIGSLKMEIEQLETELQKVRQSLDSKLEEID
ncbi:MAG: hypothetical protein APR63_12365 [Desulfuromonas sp. SDB]|nr:MAG: hypothetical protein APR63_12365 [Desulfuromonas sp. SDB]